ncbi:micronemal protein 4-like isoform X2 [Conger conger]|uniref:micronemal protein 4-like isoform X2 n=1 Tax=Conger conger TaxID=82655 RepID=UPI002A5A1A07|nr:micronemal protein 4-like isoform X2 [Conger conger]
MRVSLVLLCVILFWGDSLSEECVRQLQEDVDFPGSDILQIFSPDVHHCQLACTKHHSCLFFTFVRPEWTRDKRQFYCYLKYTDSGKPTKVTSLSKVTSGYSLKSCKDISSQTCLSTVYKDVDFPGSDIQQILSPDVEHCQLACTQHPSCLFFTFVRPEWTRDKRQFYCYLKHTASGRPAKITSLSEVTSGYSLKTCQNRSSQTCLSTVYKDVDFPGSDIQQILSPDVEHCQLACTQHPSCLFFTFLRPEWTRDKRQFYCYLKRTDSGKPTKITSLSEVTTGYSLKTCQDRSTQTCLSTVYKDVDFPGSDIQQILSPDVEHCQLACTQHPSCLFFTFLHPEWTRDKRQFYCYLKQTDNGSPAKIISLSEVTSGFSLKTCKDGSSQTCLSTVYKDVDFPGSDIQQILSPDVEHCQLACTQHPSCLFFTFVRPEWTRDKRQFYCYLKHTASGIPTKITSLSEVTSGYSLKSCKDQSSQTCLSTVYKDVDFPGSDIHQILSPDVHHCQLACTQHPSCLFFTFVRPEWTRDKRQFFCYLKRTDTGMPTKITSLSEVTSGYSLKNCNNTSIQTCLPTVYKDVDFTGVDYAALFTADYQDCQESCTKDPGCQFFTFVDQDYPTSKYRNKCHLKHTRVFPSPPRVNRLNGVASGFSHRFCTGPNTDGKNCQYKIQADMDFPGNDFERVPSPSPEYCHFLCTIHPRCTFYSYSRREMLCHLKHNKDERPFTSKQGMMSGTPTRFCETTNGDCVKTPYENIDFLASDRRFVLLDDPQACQETCTADPDCQFYTYVYTSFQGPTHRRRCYLKQVITVPLPPTVVAMRGVVSGFHQRGCQSGGEKTGVVG